MNPIQYAENVALMWLLYITGALLVFWGIYWITVGGTQIFGTSLPDEAEWDPSLDEQIAIARMAKDFDGVKELIRKKREKAGHILTAEQIKNLVDSIEEVGYWDGRDVQIPIEEEKEIRRLMR